MRILRRILVGLLVLVLTAGLALAASVAWDRAQTAGTVASLSNVSFQSDSGPTVLAYEATPTGPGPHPAVVMIHEFWGLRSDITGKADALAELGYHVVAPDTFRGVSVRTVPAAIWNVIATPREQINADLATVMTALQADPRVDPDRIAVMGFCYGGGAALAFSLQDDRPAATGVFYGTLETDPARLAALPGPVLGIFGEEDAQIAVAEVDAFEAGLAQAGVPHEITVYPGVGHAFVGGMDEIAAGGPPQAAWNQFVAWLEGALQAGP